MLTVLLGLVWSCAQPPVRPPEGPFYVTSESTYLRDGPSFGSNILGSLYQGDRVDRVDTGSESSSWWRVASARTGETGWILKELLSQEPVPTVFYYVNENSLPLLEAPASDSASLQLLFRADKVQRVATGDQGWWRVLALKSRALGWVPAGALTDKLEEAKQVKPRKPYYYVAVRKLELRGLPFDQGAVVRTLEFNDQVQKIGEAEGWFKVRQPASGAVGWLRSHQLETLPLVRPRGVPPAKSEPRPFKQMEEPSVEPEFM